MLNAYFDTSVIVTLMLKEPRWAVLQAWMSKEILRAHFSDFGWGEFISAIGLRVRRGELAEHGAKESIAILSDYLSVWARLPVESPDLNAAAEMITDFTLNLRFPDAIHIAIARRSGCTLVTGDDRQFAAAGRLGVPAINPFAS